MSGGEPTTQQLRKLEAVKRSLAIANRVTSSAIVEARKTRRLSGGKKRRRSSGSKSKCKGKTCSTGKRRRRSPKRK